MASRRTRLAILGALLLSLLAGPASALCLPGIDAACCCAKGKCPKPEQKLQAPRCCEPVQPASVPVSGTPDGSAPAGSHGLHVGPTFHVPVNGVAHEVSQENSALNPSTVSLYTLHAAFLI